MDPGCHRAGAVPAGMVLARMGIEQAAAGAGLRVHRDRLLCAGIPGKMLPEKAACAVFRDNRRSACVSDPAGARRVAGAAQRLHEYAGFAVRELFPVLPVRAVHHLRDGPVLYVGGKSGTSGKPGGKFPAVFWEKYAYGACDESGGPAGFGEYHPSCGMDRAVCADGNPVDPGGGSGDRPAAVRCACGGAGQAPRTPDSDPVNMDSLRDTFIKQNGISCRTKSIMI